MKNNKLINFILEFSQIMLVFLGVYSAITCTATSLELTYDTGLFALLMLGASVLFYGLFTVLETFRRGKLYGILGLLVFYVALAIRFSNEMKKGAVTMVNSFLKQFMSFTESRMTLFTYKDTANVSLLFCTTLMLVLIGVLMIAIISAFFYRKRRSIVFLVATLPFVVLPLAIGKMGYFSNFFTYLIILITIIGTRHMKTDATDRRLRQKLSIILVILGLVSGGVSYVYMPPERYERGKTKILQVQNSIKTMSTWASDDVFTFLKSYFGEEPISYGKIGKKDELVHSGKTLIRISSKGLNKEHCMYLKGYTGDVYENNKWSSLKKDDDYMAELEELEKEGLSPDKWHIKLRNMLGDDQKSGVYNVWQTDVLSVQNLAFGYGNHLVPYEPTIDLKTETDGRATVDNPGVQYSVEYYNSYSQVLKRDFWTQNFTLGDALFWDSTKIDRRRIREFVDKYYLQVPDSVQKNVEEYIEYLNTHGDYYNKYKNGTANAADVARATKEFLNSKVSYSLKPGKTPSDTESIDYFLNVSKKGYCTYYATTSAILMRSVGIPTRFVEGMCVTQDQLSRDGEWIDIPDDDAHAWIEVYTDEYGFVPLEVTPGRGENDDTGNTNNTENKDPSADTTTNNNQQPDEKPDEATPEPQEVDATPTPAVSEVPEENMEFNDIDGNEEPSDEEMAEKKSRTIKWIILDIVIILALAVAFLEAQRRIRLYIFKMNQKQMKGKRKIRMMYHHILPVFISAGVLYRGQSVAEYTEEIAEKLELKNEQLEFFVAMIYRARFGADDISEEDMKQFTRDFRVIRNTLYTNAKLWKRLYYMYIVAL